MFFVKNENEKFKNISYHYLKMILKNKNILITGAGKGIGEACVKNFLLEGGIVFALINQKR